MLTIDANGECTSHQFIYYSTIYYRIESVKVLGESCPELHRRTSVPEMNLRIEHTSRTRAARRIIVVSMFNDIAFR